MYMVGGGSGRVSRGPRAYPGATRFMHMEPEKERRDWKGRVFDVAAAVFYFSVIILALNGLVLTARWFMY